MVVINRLSCPVEGCTNLVYYNPHVVLLGLDTIIHYIPLAGFLKGRWYSCTELYPFPTLCCQAIILKATKGIGIMDHPQWECLTR